MAKVSVITINYNNREGLEKTIQNVLKQTFDDFEYIVIDGGGTKGDKEVIEKYSDRIQYWISEPDKGVYNAMNKGILASKGEFLIFMNSGDVFHDADVLKKTASYFSADYDIYYGDNYKIKSGKGRKKTYPKKLSFSFFYSSSINHQSAFIRRQLFFDYFLYNESYKIASDWEFFVFTICHKNVPYKYIPETISDYDYTGISSTGQHSDLIKQERMEVMQKYFPLFVDDYKKEVAELNSKRIQQVFHIKKFPIAWKILSMTISLILLFIPKYKK